MLTKDIFKILSLLNEKGVGFCFQHQAKNNYYNLAVEDINNKTHNFNSNNILDIEGKLKIIWGHLLTPTTEGFPTPWQR